MRAILFSLALVVGFSVIYAADPPPATPKTFASPIPNAVPTGPKYQLWTEDDPTGQLVGARQWYVDPDQHWLYIAVSPAELRTNHTKLFKAGEKAHPWQAAMTAGFIRNIWLAPDKFAEPLLMLRADKFELLKADISQVHEGKLPWQITATESDDQLQVASK